jgi:hypothetical protein
MYFILAARLVNPLHVSPCQSISVCRWSVKAVTFETFTGSEFLVTQSSHEFQSSQSTLNRFGAQGLDEGHQGRMFLLKGPQWLSGSGFHQQQRGEDFLSGTGWVMKI